MANEVPNQHLLQYVTENVTPLDFAANEIVLINQSPPRIDKTYLRTAAEDGIKLSCNFGGSPEVVRVDECDQIGARELPTGVSCGRNAGVLLRNQSNSTVNSRMSIYDRSRAVGGAIVYDDDFQLPVRLAPYASERVLKGTLCIVGRDHDAY